MFSNGIPPSQDRRDRQFIMLVTGLVFLVIFMGLFYVLFSKPVDAPVIFDRDVKEETQTLEAYLAEKERASAYEAVRDHLDEKRNEPGIVAVFCRDCRHRWEGGHIEFRGDVDFELSDGRLVSQVYTAVLSGSSVEGWTVESVQLSPIGQPAPSL